ncbi:MAG: hypothetical protein M1816_006141 [Peltula sp. TS41687]|nr:MAG: hypothetical protein M1816_006141 [Peltula sp. TS41687]
MIGDDSDDWPDLQAAPPRQAANLSSDANYRGICIGTWRDSPFPSTNEKHVVIAWISPDGRFHKQVVDHRLDGTSIDARQRNGKRRVRIDALELLERYLDIAFETTPFEGDPESVLENAIAREWQQIVEDRGW